jgi:putative DNA methylase
MTKAKKLIEVAMPIKEISAESVRDKSIRHGHISTLHLWWARRPLPVCRAVIFASLVPDPLDPECPQAFCDAVQDLLANNPLYAPYPDIPLLLFTNSVSMGQLPVMFILAPNIELQSVVQASVL